MAAYKVKFCCVVGKNKNNTEIDYFMVLYVYIYLCVTEMDYSVNFHYKIRYSISSSFP